MAKNTVTTEKENPTTNEEVEAKSKPIQKLIAVVEDEKGISFRIEGIGVEEAMILITKGYVKFQKAFEDYIRNQFK